MDGIDRNQIREELKENIDYEHLRSQCPYDDVESLLELMVDVVSSTASTIRIGGEVLPLGPVKERFRQLDSSHIEYVIDSLKQTTTKINNILAYETEPFPGKRTRKYPKNRNESLIFCGMLVHAA